MSEKQDYFDHKEEKHDGIAGKIYGNVSNASTIYGEDKFNTPRGHGFAAERANHLYDKVAMKDAVLVGEEIDPSTGHITKNGADRIVDGVNIQTKYCESGSKCVSECFRDGKFRYLNQDGTPMQIEVPSDKYEAAIKAMEERIKNGEVPGISDPQEAKNIIRKGHFTYTQAKNIAKAGTIESITYDSVNGAIVATSAFGISTAISFAVAIWSGDSFEVALKTATYTGLKVGGTTFATAVLAGQLSKAGLNSMLVGSSEAMVKVLGPKGSALLVNAFRSGKNIYGAAAMKSAAKMLRSNVITGVASVVVLSAGDVINIFRSRISGKQLFKNLTETAVSVAGGTAGWVGGAAAGAALGSAVPIVGTAIGSFIGGLVGAMAAGTVSAKATNKVLSTFIEDDADEMVRIIEKEFTSLAIDYLISKEEAEQISDELKNHISGKTLKDMYASSNRKDFARNLLIPCIETIISKRKHITLPTAEEMTRGLSEVLEEIAESENDAFNGNDTPKKARMGRSFQYDYSQNNQDALAAIALYYYFAKQDNKLYDEYPIEKFLYSSEIQLEIDALREMHPLLFGDVKKYLDNISNDTLTSLNSMVAILAENGAGITAAKTSAKQRFDKYLSSRHIDPDSSHKRISHQNCKFNAIVEFVSETQNGISVKAKAKKGEAHVNDWVKIVDRDGYEFDANIRRIYANNKYMDSIKQGETATIFFENLPLIVHIGDCICCNSVNATPNDRNVVKPNFHIDYANDDKEALAAIALYYYFARQDKKLLAQDPRKMFIYSSAIQQKVNDISSISPFLFSSARIYLDTIPNKTLSLLNQMVEELMKTGSGETVAKLSAKKRYDEYLSSRLYDNISSIDHINAANTIRNNAKSNTDFEATVEYVSNTPNGVSIRICVQKGSINMSDWILIVDKQGHETYANITRMLVNGEYRNTTKKGESATIFFENMSDKVNKGDRLINV